MAKYDKAIVKKICELIERDSYTIPEICELVGIAESTYHEWKLKKPEFSEAIKKARQRFDDFIIEEAKKSLVKKIRGYTVQEKKTVTVDTGTRDEAGKPIVKVKEHTVTDKHFQPDTAAIIFTLINRDSDNWKNKQSNEIDVKDLLSTVEFQIGLKDDAKK